MGESLYLLALLLHKLEGEAGFCRLLLFDTIKEQVNCIDGILGGILGAKCFGGLSQLLFTKMHEKDVSLAPFHR